MVLFDINALPDGIDIYAWLELAIAGYCLYDAKNGIEPVITDHKIALYDIDKMSDQETAKVNLLIKDIIEKRMGIDKDTMDIVRENNRKLIEYLKEVNNQ